MTILEMGAIMLEAIGYSGRVKVDDFFVTITHDGVGGTLNKIATLTNVGLAGEKRIPIDSIGSVQFRSAGKLMQNAPRKQGAVGDFARQTGWGAFGFIQFAAVGGIEQKSKGLSNWRQKQDENTVLFDGTQEEDFKKVRDFIEQRIIARQTGASPAGSPVSAPQQPQLSRLDQLKSLGELRAAGVLTDEEFDIEKQLVMSGQTDGNDTRFAELRMLAELRDGEVLTDDEFESEKARVLSRNAPTPPAPPSTTPSGSPSPTPKPPAPSAHEPEEPKSWDWSKLRGLSLDPTEPD